MAKVEETAIKLAHAYEVVGVHVDIKTLSIAALLHDSFKVSSITNFDLTYFDTDISEEDLQVWQSIKEKYPTQSDAKAMSQYLIDMGESEIANLVAKHDFACVITDLTSLEEKILYYADKRVKHDELVPLKERLRDGRERYLTTGKQLERNVEIEKLVYKLEEELFEPLLIDPKDLN